MFGRNRTFFYLAVLFISFASMAAAVSADGSDAQNVVSNFEEFKAAVEGGQSEITLTADIEFTGTVTAPGAFTVNTGGHTMTVGSYLVLSVYTMTVNVSNQGEMDAAVASVNRIQGPGSVLVQIQQSFEAFSADLSGAMFMFTNNTLDSVTISGLVSGNQICTITAKDNSPEDGTSAVRIEHSDPSSTQYTVSNLIIDVRGTIVSPFVAWGVSDLALTNITAKNGLGSGINILGGTHATLAGATTSGNGWAGIRVSVWDGQGEKVDNVAVNQGTYSFTEAFPFWKEIMDSEIDFAMAQYWADVEIDPSTQHYMVYFLSPEVKGNMHLLPNFTQIATLQDGVAWSVPEGQTLTVGEGLSISIPQGSTFTNNGTIVTDGAIEGIVVNNGDATFEVTKEGEMTAAAAAISHMTGAGNVTVKVMRDFEADISSVAQDSGRFPFTNGTLTSVTITGQYAAGGKQTISACGNGDPTRTGTSILLISPGIEAGTQYNVTDLTVTAYGESYCLVHNPIVVYQASHVTLENVAANYGLGFGINIIKGSSAVFRGASTVGNGVAGVKVGIYGEVPATLKLEKNHTYSFSEVFPIWKERPESTVDFDGVRWYTADVQIAPTTNQHYTVYYPDTHIKGTMKMPLQGFTQVATLESSTPGDPLVWTVDSAETLTVGNGLTLNVPQGTTLKNNGTINLGMPGEYTTTTQIIVSGGTVTKDDGTTGKINIYSSGTEGSQSPIFMSGGTFEDQIVDINANKTSFIGIETLSDSIHIDGNTFNMNGEGGTNKYGICAFKLTSQQSVWITDNAFTSEGWINYCVQIGSGDTHTIPQGARFIVKDNDTTGVDSYEWSVNKTQADKAALRINANGAVIGSSGSGILNVVTNQCDIAISQGNHGSNRIQESMTLDYLGTRTKIAYLTVDDGVTLTIPADQTARSYGHLEIDGTLDIEGTFHNGGSIELGPVGSLFINGHLFNILTFELNGGTGHNLPAEYDYAYEFYLPIESDVSKQRQVFGGWFNDSACTDGPVTWIPAHSMEARTFYAKWCEGTQCGDNLYYAKIDGVVVMVIQGAETQTMNDRQSGTSPEWWWGTEIKGVSMPEGLTNIGTFAFEGCVLITGVQVPSTVTEIGRGAFKDCTGLKEQIALDRASALSLAQDAFHSTAATRLFVTDVSMVTGDGRSTCAILVTCGCEYHVVFGHVAINTAWSTQLTPTSDTLAGVFKAGTAYYAVPYDSFASTVLVYSVTTTGSYTTGPDPGAVSLAAALGPSPLPDRSADPQALRSRAGLREDEVVPEQEEQPQEQEEVSL